MQLNNSLQNSLPKIIFLFFLLLLTSCFDKSESHLDELIIQLDSPGASARNSAILDIGRFGPYAQKAVPKLVLMLNSEKSRGIRTSAAYALRSIGTKEAIQALDSYKK